MPNAKTAPWDALNFGDDLHIVSDIAVSHEANDAYMILASKDRAGCDGVHHFVRHSWHSGKKLFCLRKIFRRRRTARKEDASIPEKGSH